MPATEIKVYFNFRSPYCYLASKRMFGLLDDFDVRFDWRPFGGWDGRSPPERAKIKIPIVRQDVARWAKRMNIPFNPPPITTEPTRAGAISLLAEEKGLLRSWVEAVMHAEWGEGRDIGQLDVLRDVSKAIGLDPDQAAEAADDPARRQHLQDNARLARADHVMGVPSFVIGDQVFWGNDRIDFVREHLQALGASKS